MIIILGDARALLASYYKTGIRLQDLHPTTRQASNRYKTSIRLQDKHPTAIRQASDRYKTSIRPLQDKHPTTRQASDYKTSIQPP